MNDCSLCNAQLFPDYHCLIRDRRNRYIVLFGGFSAVNREPLKVRRQEQGIARNGFREIFQMNPTEKYVCI